MNISKVHGESPLALPELFVRPLKIKMITEKKQLKPEFKVMWGTFFGLFIFLSGIFGLILGIGYLGNMVSTTKSDLSNIGIGSTILIYFFLLLLPVSFMLFDFLKDTLRQWEMSENGLEFKTIFRQKVFINWDQIAGITYWNDTVFFNLEEKGKRKGLSYISYDDYKLISKKWALGKFINNNNKA